MVAAATPGPHGWIVLDKPVGIGSTTCVSVVKRVLRAAGYPKVKVGHGGTLDPLASGVLPIALGEATKLCGRMLDATKAYEFTIHFGEETTTLDAEGEVSARSEARPSLADLEACLPRFTGKIEQLPPAFSALKVGGKRAYHLARAGEDVALEPRPVTVFELLPTGEQREPLEEVTLTATVSKGTYIRSLARDIAHALGTVGHVTMLRRTKAGPFTLGQAISLDFLEERAKARTLDGAVLPLAAGLDGIPALPVSPQDAQLLRHGQKLPGSPVQGPHRSTTSMGPRPGLYLATQDGCPVALVEVSGDVLQVVRGFNL
jgi:tRNA pseudouridine55 synthase